eukprot:CAMPEP_0198271100 /NCGR_PEP_ID=MMETSP1447-20131203/47792_1 /TAXON_ID=420782 /ORGANISM="Chaetoceros dichaeta, Strain CCMP1751" /LENGTH=556 /DNA_ID=CAMNT_0043963501 /DNA_START=123 /DNA_END=1793 /DNA_ORIENTATION=-
MTGGVGMIGGVGYGTYLYKTDEGTSRMMRAYGTFGPVVLHYRLLEARQKYIPEMWPVCDQDWIDLDNRYAQPTIESIGNLQGMYCKYGQTAAGLTNTFSDIWVHELRKLESDVPPRSASVVHQTIREELTKLGGGTQSEDDVFESFDPIPLGSASIGQVHRARLKTDGREVAVKVQYPDVGQLFRDDMRAIRRFCELLAPENVCSLAALEKQNATELDYTIEASNLKEVYQNMKRAGFLPTEVLVPLPIDDLSTKRMLVMELLPGPKLIDGVRAFFKDWAQKNGTTLEALETEARRKIDQEGIPAKYEGPSARQIQRYQTFVHCRNTLLNGGIALHNATIGRMRKRTWEYRTDTVGLNLPRLVDILMRTHGYQLLKDGCFNADPHGGNFLLLPDDRIGMIDYGATKRLTRNERLNVCLIYAALHRNDEDILYELSEVAGYKSRYGRKDVLMRLMRFSYNTWGKDLMKGKNVQQFIDELKTLDPWDEVPDNLVMVSFMSIRLRSLALGMNHPVCCSDWWGPIAEEVLREEGLPYESWNRDVMIQHRPEVNMQKFKFG